MTSARHTSFASLDEASFSTYVSDLLDRHHGDAERQRNVAYLQSTLAKDEAVINIERTALILRRRLARRQRAAFETLTTEHDFDFAQAASLFTAVAKTDAEILQLLTQDDVTVYLRGRTLTGNIRITGDRVRLIGLGATGSATAGTLAHSVIFNTDKIEIGGQGITIEGIHFKTSGEYAVTFAATKGVGLTLQDCTFESVHATYADARFYYGDGAGGGGHQTIKNCRIKDFGSWMLGDATTSSAFGTTVRLAGFTLDSCKIENCAGCFAVRGPASGQPNGPIAFTDNLIAFGAGGIHAAFWDMFEASEGISQVTCTGNTVTGMVLANTRGLFQCWSKNPVPWTVTFENNTVSNFQAAIHIACGPASSSFYAPNTHDEAYKITSAAGKMTACTYGASFVYPWDDATKVYAPLNALAEATEPTVSFADGFTSAAVFAHA